MQIRNQNMPRWLIFTIDLLVVFFSIIMAYLLRFNFDIPASEIALWPRVFALIIIVRAISFLLAKTYAGIIRYTSTEDAVRIFLVILAGSAFFALANILSFHFIDRTYIVPFSIIIIEFLMVIFVMVTFRVVIKIAYLEIMNPGKGRSRVIIYGAGEAGLITKRSLDRDLGIKYKVVAYIDDDKTKWGKKIEGITIFGFDKLNDLIQQHDVESVIIAIQRLKAERKQNIVDICIPYNVHVLNVPPVSSWINGQLSFKQIKKVKIEDLLEREEIKLDTEKIGREIRGKTIMVTGASGSIGSELVRQILNFDPKNIILLDQAESAMFDLDIELSDKFPKKNYEIAIADICNPSRMNHAFEVYRPQLVYHAAAYKHVPMMENNPSEAIYTNVRGTQILAGLADKYNVDKFIMISTDKAVNPTNVMGASKRIAEMFVQAFNSQSTTRFITTRFGNVLGSNGSAINLFRKQIEKGGPVTVTHPEVIRYFMTIPEACQLVLEAGAMGSGGEIFLFDMGKPVKIIDLANRMIRLSGLEIGKDIQIKFTGLRPGEKLYEELLTDGENNLPTHHPQIMIARMQDFEYTEISKYINELISLFEKQDNKAIVKKMKQIVPEFKSQNSIYEKLDTE